MRAELDAWLPTMGFDLVVLEWVDQARHLAPEPPFYAAPAAD